LSQTTSWFDIQNVAGATDIYIYEQIGRGGIPAVALLEPLSKIKSNVINVHLNSIGGGVDDGLAIFNSLKNHSARVHTFVDGLAASIASVIFQAGDQRTMMQGSTMMVHEPRVSVEAVVIGSADDFRHLAAEATKQSTYLDKVGESLAEIYASASGGDEAEWRERMKAETWYRAHEAVEAGLADVVSPSKAKAQAVNLADGGFKNIPEWLTPEPVAAIVLPDPIDAVRQMKIPPDSKRRAIAHLRAQAGALVPA
jgi:ATP-dependent protease ClpP protease subunit